MDNLENRRRFKGATPKLKQIESLKRTELIGRLPRTTSKLWEMDSCDPFQLFEVNHRKCLILRVEVYKGTNITKGRVGDWMDVPDPYLILQVKGTPNRRKQTPVIDNCPNPEWNVCFQFFIDPSEKRELFVTLMDSNYVMDQEMGNKAIDLSHLTPGVQEEIDVEYNCGARVSMKLTMVEEKKPDLRFSLALSDGEKKFVKRRRMHIFEAMKSFLGKKNAPEAESEVPVIAVLGSGGGFRATMSFAGVFKALHESGLLDCVMYVASLSGSSWYLSCLYSHPEFPHILEPGDLIPELRERMEYSWTNLLTPSNMYNYLKQVMAKSSKGQPVSFTDFFGHLVGDTLLKERKESLLSDQRQKLARGQAPMPMYTCLNVKKDVSARVFQDWMEFSPFEIGCAKYGTFFRTEDFGSKFYVGKLLSRFKESPLHFLMGVWGSAFCILFKRLISEGKKKEIPQLLRGESERKNSMSEETSRTYSVDAESDREEDGINTLPTVGEDSELFEYYCTNMRKNCTMEAHSQSDEMMSARNCLNDGSSNVLWGEVEGNSDSGSSDDETDGNGEESSVEEFSEADSIIPMVESEADTSEEGRRVPSPDNSGSSNQKSRLRKLSKQKAMEIADVSPESKEELSKHFGDLVNISEGESLKPVRRKSEPKRNTGEDNMKSAADNLGSANGPKEAINGKRVRKSSGTHSNSLGKSNMNNLSSKADGNVNNGSKNQIMNQKEKRRSHRGNQREVRKNFWNSVLQSIFQSGGLGDTRAGRAGLIFNPLRGLSLQQTFPISPPLKSTEKSMDDERDFKEFHEAVEVQAKKLYLVDSGLTFNSPFPLLLRPQRAVDIYLSFDFSGRPSDNHEPFKEIILAEKWARLNSVPFPPVAELSKKYLMEPMREIYVFENPSEQQCPIIIHFIIFNGQFRHFKDLGVERKTEEEKAFADFKVFSDPEDTYSMFHFCYDSLQFNRMCQLMEFNTKLGMNIIKKCIKMTIEKKRKLISNSHSQQRSMDLHQNYLQEESEGSDEDIFYDSIDDLSCE